MEPADPRRGDRSARQRAPLDSTKPSPSAWIKFTCRDNGTGMASDVLERIFGPSYTTKPVGQGTGFGRATVRHLVTEMGGRVEVSSTLGAGTAFALFLPVFPLNPSLPGSQSRPSPRWRSRPRHSRFRGPMFSWRKMVPRSPKSSSMFSGSSTAMPLTGRTAKRPHPNSPPRPPPTKHSSLI